MCSGNLPPPPAAVLNAGSPGEPPARTSLSTQDGCQLRINVSQAEEGVVTVAVTGELDLATAPMVGDTFHKINSAQPLHVHFDLSGVNFCDAAASAHSSPPTGSCAPPAAG